MQGGSRAIPMMHCFQLYYRVVAHVISHFDLNTMIAVRTVERSDRPFEVNKLVYLHCIDERTKKFVPITSFPCMEILYEGLNGGVKISVVG